MQDVELLYISYSKRIYSFMYYRVGQHDLAQELTQMVFEKVIRKYRTYNEKRGTQEVWLFTIARNILTDHYRSSSRNPVFSIEESEETASDAPQPEENVLAAEQRTALTAAMRKLSKREHVAVSLKYGAGMRNTELAKVLGVTEKNAGVILHRALRKLQKYLEKQAYDA